MLRVAIVGCGRIADDHIRAIKRIKRCEIVSACDEEDLMALQLCERFGISKSFGNIRQMLEEGNLDVVHITTPPQSHYKLAKLCIEYGTNIYVEKPFALNAIETEEILDLANQRGVKATVGHDKQFTTAARRFRSQVSSGYLGSMPLHMESYYCYDISEESYASRLLDSNYWVRSLPGGLLHNVISHGICRIAEYFNPDGMEIIAYGTQSSLLKRQDENSLIDELRVIFSNRVHQTAYFTFSTQFRPKLHQMRAYGSKRGLILDDDKQLNMELRGRKYKSYLETFLGPLELSLNCSKSFFYNIRAFAQKNFHLKGGLYYLIREYYHSIDHDGPPPIPYSEIILTAKMMDEIFRQITQK